MSALVVALIVGGFFWIVARRRQWSGVVGFATCSVAAVAFAAAAAIYAPPAAVRATLSGLVAMFVPASVLRHAGLLAISGGRGFLFVTDIDSVFIDASLVAVLALVVQARGALKHSLPSLLPLAGVSLTSALLLSYIVTNFGTLVRIRLVTVLPLWFVPFALAASRKAPSNRGAAEPMAARSV